MAVPTLNIICNMPVIHMNCFVKARARLKYSQLMTRANNRTKAYKIMVLVERPNVFELS